MGAGHGCRQLAISNHQATVLMGRAMRFVTLVAQAAVVCLVTATLQAGSSLAEKEPVDEELLVRTESGPSVVSHLSSWLLISYTYY